MHPLELLLSHDWLGYQAFQTDAFVFQPSPDTGLAIGVLPTLLRQYSFSLQCFNYTGVGAVAENTANGTPPQTPSPWG